MFYFFLFILVSLQVAQSCPTLCDPMDCGLPDSSIHGIFQARVLEWVAISFSRRSSQSKSNPGLPHCRQTLNPLSHQGSLSFIYINPYSFLPFTLFFFHHSSSPPYFALKWFKVYVKGKNNSDSILDLSLLL